MAVNIYLVLFRNWSTRQLRGLDHKYFLACYGISLIPAIVYIFIETKDRGKIYGPAVVSARRPTLAGLRLTYVYSSGVGFRWNGTSYVLPSCMASCGKQRQVLSGVPTIADVTRIAVLIAMVIYIMAGIRIYKKRAALDGFLNPFNESPFIHVMTTTEVTVTSENRNQSRPRVHSELDVKEVQEVGHHEEGYDPYSVNVEIGRPQRLQRPRGPSVPAVFRLPTVTRAAALSEENAESFLYARVAFLFFVALLITWVPSSVNRAYALAHPGRVNFGLNYSSALVFSVQGVLNCLVYMMTSQTAVRNLWHEMCGRNAAQSRSESACTDRIPRKSKREGRQRLDSDSTSMTNLTSA